jgi:hypothetical protein
MTFPGQFFAMLMSTPLGKGRKERKAQTHVEQDTLDVDLDNVLILVHLEPGGDGTRDDG